MEEKEKGVLTPEQEKEALFQEIDARIKNLFETSEKATQEVIDKQVKLLQDATDKLSDEGKKELDEKLKSQIDDISDKQEKILKTHEEMGLAIKKLEDNKSSRVVPKSFRECIKEAILEKKDQVLAEKNDDWGKRLSLREYFKKNGSRATMPEMILKAAVDMLQSNIVQSEVQLVRLTELDSQRVSIPLTIYPHALTVFPKKRIVKPSMSLLVAYSYEDGAGTKTEGSAGSKSSFLWKTIQFPSFYINTHFTLSDETLDDLEETLDEVGIVAPDKILDNIDGQIFQDGGNGTTAIQGLFVGGTTCTDFVASTYEDTVDGGNLVDLIAKMKLAVRKLKYRPNFVGLNSTDIDRIQCLKDQLDNSIADRRLVFNANGDLVKIAGLSVVENDSITANTCIVGDTSKAMIGIRKDMTMEIGYNSADFTEGQKTIMIKTRLAFGVRDKAAFQYSSDMDTDLNTIRIIGA